MSKKQESYNHRGILEIGYPPHSLRPASFPRVGVAWGCMGLHGVAWRHAQCTWGFTTAPRRPCGHRRLERVIHGIVMDQKWTKRGKNWLKMRVLGVLPNGVSNHCLDSWICAIWKYFSSRNMTDFADISDIRALTSGTSCLCHAISCPLGRPSLGGTFSALPYLATKPAEKWPWSPTPEVIRSINWLK